MLFFSHYAPTDVPIGKDRYLVGSSVCLLPAMLYDMAYIA